MAVGADRAAKVLDGFRIDSFNMRDAVTGELVWQSDAVWDKNTFATEIEARLPKSLLGCKAISKEITFSSIELMDKLRLVQKIHLHGQEIEEWRFEFGFVIPNSTNTWQQVIEADSDNMIPAEVLSGNMTIENTFYDGEMIVSKSTVRVYYE